MRYTVQLNQPSFTIWVTRLQTFTTHRHISFLPRFPPLVALTNTNNSNYDRHLHHASLHPHQCQPQRHYGHHAQPHCRIECQFQQACQPPSAPLYPAQGQYHQVVSERPSLQQSLAVRWIYSPFPALTDGMCGIATDPILARARPMQNFSQQKTLHSIHSYQQSKKSLSTCRTPFESSQRLSNPLMIYTLSAPDKKTSNLPGNDRDRVPQPPFCLFDPCPPYLFLL